MRIIFERSGGFMGLKTSLDLNLQELPAEQSENLRQLVEEANFFALKDDLPARPTADGFSYTITVKTDTASHTVRTSDAAAPESLRALLQELTLQARSHRTSH